jgi:O-antigen ligase
MDLLADFYALDNLVVQERLRAAFLLLAIAGVALLFLRGGAAKVAGALLILTRIVAMPMRGMEWLLLGAIAVIGLIAIVLRQAETRDRDQFVAPEVLEAPLHDDASEPAPCPACRAVIPAGSSRCPSCGWTYAADVS